MQANRVRDGPDISDCYSDVLNLESGFKSPGHRIGTVRCVFAFSPDPQAQSIGISGIDGMHLTTSLSLPELYAIASPYHAPDRPTLSVHLLVLDFICVLDLYLSIHCGNTGSSMDTAPLISPSYGRKVIGSCHWHNFLWLFGGRRRASHLLPLGLDENNIPPGKVSSRVEDKWLESDYHHNQRLDILHLTVLTYPSDIHATEGIYENPFPVLFDDLLSHHLVFGVEHLSPDLLVVCLPICP